ncbi:MAG: hypothetical protein PSX71_13980 [bacterium]|nr:hypothetical protein [bacterium]
MSTKPLTTNDLYEGVKAVLRKAGKPDTPYGVAKFLGASRQCGYYWRDGESTMSDEHAKAAAEALGINPDYAVACMHLEREKNEEMRPIWARIVSAVPYAACLALAVFALPFLGVLRS